MRLTALVEHILAQREGHMSEIIAEELDISRVGPANAQSLHASTSLAKWIVEQRSSEIPLLLLLLSGNISRTFLSI